MSKVRINKSKLMETLLFINTRYLDRGTRQYYWTGAWVMLQSLLLCGVGWTGGGLQKNKTVVGSGIWFIQRYYKEVK